MAQPYQLMPDLTPEEYAVLKESIRRQGVLVPVEKDDRGNILDGHHRDRAWGELRAGGVKLPDYPVIIRPGLSEEEKRALVRSLNLDRRHLTREQRGQLIADQLRETPQRSDRQIAEALGCDHKTVGAVRDGLEGRGEIPHVATRTDTLGREQPSYRPSVIAKNAREERDALAAIPDIPEGVLPNRPVSSWSAAKVAERHRVRARLEGGAVPVGGDDLGLRTGDFREAGAPIPDGSVDLVVTDPPYLAEHLPIYADLGRFAARVLRPGGLCLAYVGNFHLLRAGRLLAEHLQSVTVFAALHSGGGPVMRAYHFRNLWKPVLVFAKPPVQAWWEIMPDCVSGGREKTEHAWQQAEAEAAYFIRHLCPAGGLVCDPFAGSGTCLVAAAKLGRRYVGFEIDPETADRARARLRESLEAAVA